VNGAAANTDIPVPGIKPADVLVAVLEFRPIPTSLPTNATPVIAGDRAAVTTVLQGVIRVAANTTGNQLLVFWWSV